MFYQEKNLIKKNINKKQKTKIQNYLDLILYIKKHCLNVLYL